MSWVPIMKAILWPLKGEDSGFSCHIFFFFALSLEIPLLNPWILINFCTHVINRNSTLLF